MGVFRFAVVTVLLSVAISPAFAQTKAAVDVAKTPAAPAPIPIPYPNVTITVPSTCKAAIDKATADLAGARSRLESAIAKEKSPAADYLATERAFVAEATCCAYAVPVSVGEVVPNATSQTLLDLCAAERQRAWVMRDSASGARTAPPAKQTGWDLVQSCSQIADRTADAARAAAKKTLAETTKQALVEVERASGNLAKAHRDCLATRPPPPADAPPPPAGPQGACDATHACGPALECRDGRCRLPCACLAPCFIEQNACKQNVAVTRTVRKACAVCVPPCSKDGDGVCRSDTTEYATEKRSCTPACP